MMDSNLPPTNPSPGDALLNVNRVSAQYLLDTSKWGKFLSIMGFIISGLMFVFAFFAGSLMTWMSGSQAPAMPKMMGLMMNVVYSAMGILYLFPSWYLYKYSQKLGLALRSRDNHDLAAAFENQKSLYKFWGIFTIVLMSIYAILILIMIAASVFSAASAAA